MKFTTNPLKIVCLISTTVGDCIVKKNSFVRFSCF